MLQTGNLGYYRLTEYNARPFTELAHHNKGPDAPVDLDFRPTVELTSP